MSREINKSLAYIANAWLACGRLDSAAAKLWNGARPATKNTVNVLRTDLFDLMRAAQDVVSQAKKPVPLSPRQRFTRWAGRIFKRK